MPLLRRGTFVRQETPEDLKPNDEVFYCRLTGEIFSDYEKFFERVILCNSLVWSCTLTGRSNLTFQEALHSEKRALEQLNSFPDYLQRPLLYLAHLTHRSRLIDVVDDVFLFAKDRYFIGESVFVNISDERKPCKVVKVIPLDGDNKLPNGKADDNGSDSDVICLDDDEQPPPPKKIKLSQRESNEEEKSTVFGSSPLLYQYVVQDSKDNDSFAADAKSLNRKKGIFSRDKCKMFMKQHCAVAEDGIWRVKAKYVNKYRFSTLNFNNFFAGSEPSFEVSEARKRRPSAKNASVDETSLKSNVIDLTEDDEAILTAKKIGRRKERMSEGSPRGIGEKSKKKTETFNIDEEFRRMRQEMDERARKREQEKLDKLKAKELRKEELKRKAEEQRQKRKEENEKKKLERMQQDAILREWNKPREDLECDDLKDLPAPVPVSCSIPAEVFGEAVLVLEYLLCFQSVFEFNLPKSISVDTLGKALCDTDIDGLFADIVRELLNAVFRLQEEEYSQETSTSEEKDWKNSPDGFEECEDRSISDLIKAATAASQWPVINFGTTLWKLQLDSFTLTEILRLHLLSSGSLSGINSKYDYQQRGGYTPRDDPGLIFHQQETAILRALGERNIYDLTCSEKLKVITVLIHQLLTYVVSRDVIDDNCEKLKQIQKNLRQHQLAEQKREKDETHYKWKKRMEERQQDSESKQEEVAETETIATENEESVKKLPGRQKKVVQLQNDKDYENLPTENLDWSKIDPGERARMKEWYQRKERELMDLAVELQQGHSISPIGRDRSFRRFWVFRSIPGLFVEDQEDHISSEFLQEVSHTFAELAAQEINKNCDTASEEEKSDKENVPVNDSISVVANSDDMLKKDKVHFVSVGEQIASRNTVRWAFYSSPEDVDYLIDSLNPRGVREGLLRSALIEQKEKLKDWVGKCNILALSRAKMEIEKAVPEKRPRPRSKQAPAAFKYASAQECLDTILREMLLDIEERIDVGSLGSLKIASRADWRKELEEGNFDSQTLSLMGLHRNGSGQNTESESVVDMYHEGASSVVKNLSRALLQIEKMVDQRYFMAPFGDKGEKALKKAKHKTLVEVAVRDGGRSSRDRKDLDAKKDGTSFDSDDDEVVMPKTALERWEESLMLSTSLPQIFLHLAILESSIMWSKSALHARCRICRRKGDGERMLLCDGCDRGHHMYCLKPPVKHIPHGDWFCPSCRPNDVLHTPRKQRKAFNEDVSEDENESTLSSSEENENLSEDNLDENEDESSMIYETEENAEDTELEKGNEEDESDDEEEMEEDADEEDEVRQASTKIRFTRGTRSGKSPVLKPLTTVLSQVKTRLRNNALSSNEHSREGSQERNSTSSLTAATSRSKRKSESPLSNTCRSFGLTNTSSRPKHSKLSLDMEIGLRNGLQDDKTDESHERHLLLTKSRSKELLSTMKTCEDLINELSQRDEAWPFLKPVTRREAPDYFDIIKNPMDFSRIRNKINRFEYLHPSELLHDVRQIFGNCKEYNMPTAPQFTAGQKLESYFDKRLRELKLTSVMTASSDSESPKTRSSKKRGKRSL